MASSSLTSILFSTATTNPKTNLPIVTPKSPFRSFTKVPFRKKPIFLTLSSSQPNPSSDPDSKPDPVIISDEWGEKTEPQPEYPKASDSDPPVNDDEWEENDGENEDYVYSSAGNGSAAPASAAYVEDDNLKRCLVDTVYGTDFGFRASPEIRAEVSELVNQLEARNPTPAPVEAASLLDGNWVLVYTAFSELLPLLAAGATPLFKVKTISQSINTSTRTIVNSTILSSPFATFSFSASATFEVRSRTRIQVQFKEGMLQPPVIQSSVNLPESVDLFGQNISLFPVQQSLNPVQEAVETISRTISGQPPLKIPIPGERAASWLLITYLDNDIRIARGDGGLFVLAKEGSPLLNQ